MFTNLELKDQWNKDMKWIKCHNNFLFTFSESLPGFNVVWWNFEMKPVWINELFSPSCRRSRSLEWCRPSWMSQERSWRGRVKDTWWGWIIIIIITEMIWIMISVFHFLTPSNRCSNSRGPAWWGRCTETIRGSRPPTSRSSPDTTWRETVRPDLFIFINYSLQPL